MKKQLLQIGSLVMAFVVLFVSMGWDVKFHYCTEDHHLSGSFGATAAESCLHCCDHEHEHEGCHEAQHDALHFEKKCCCEDFDSLIQFADNYVFSTEKHLDIHFHPIAIAGSTIMDLLPTEQRVFSGLSARKIPNWRIGRIGLIFFSQLKLNPLAF